ncbi:MAG: hypothetical protein IJ873_02895 [Lachnospiraceae bacterium]|nr:hypothetical protein [Lachnospiraceae bacterium]
MKKAVLYELKLTAFALSLTAFTGCAGVPVYYDTGDNTVMESNEPEKVEAEAETEKTKEKPEEASENTDETQISEETTEIALGTSGYVITVPSDYYAGDITEIDRRDDMIAYYKSDTHLMDFDVYQFATEGRSLEEYTKEESLQYGASDYTFEKINDIALTLYYSQEEYEGGSYRVANYLFEAGNDFIELCFWLDGDDAEKLTEEIINSLARAEGDSSDTRKEDGSPFDYKQYMDLIPQEYMSPEYKQAIESIVDEAVRNALDAYDAQFDSPEFIGEVTVTGKNGSSENNGKNYDMYDVKADNGELYSAEWRYDDMPLEAGSRVQLMRGTDGSFYLDPIPKE